ncbi:hypothetical protein [Shewanella sp. Isolate11]|uniref:hypothetical protein n=1 Tax=Shewanella sp. Isolate11 TaxID=2908530 RepID=UPI001EFCDBB4|nr:hypothetical protein [Shewanella sp. Isolate11]MCG9698367.1 hypothetical protein [Shewanella sp. Isolate11]
MSNINNLTPSVNVDGTPMIEGTYVDVNGNVFGTTDSSDISTCDSMDTFESSSFDSSFDSFDSFID